MSFLRYVINKVFGGEIDFSFDKQLTWTGYRMSVWDTALNFVFEMEGGYSNDPNDAGGETNFGISKRSYPNEDIKNMTKERAAQIYQQDFWQACRCDELPARVAIVVFDAAVNQGVSAAIKMLQIALGVTADGFLSAPIMTTIYKAGPTLARRVLAQRMARYARLVMNKPTQEVWLENWSRRLMMCAELTFSFQI